MNALDKKYLISITGLQNDGQNEEEISLTTTGGFSEQDGGYFITYLEGEDFGTQDTTTTLAVHPDQIHIIRDGGVQSKMILQKGKRHLCAYDTGFGHMMVGICAERIQSDLTQSGGELDFSYAMDVNSEFTGTNHIHISVKECNPCL